MLMFVLVLLLVLVIALSTSDTNPYGAVLFGALLKSVTKKPPPFEQSTSEVF